MKIRIAVGIGSISLVIAGLMLTMTRPGEVGPFGVLAFFVLLYLSAGSIIYMLLTGIIYVLMRVLPPGSLRLWLENVSHTKVYYYTTVLALAPVVLLGMASVGSIGGLDIVLVVLFEILACFYISRRF
ncbi:hypothetical protein EOM33_01950 [Candidatus Saccharibacteria bacterium]|jgi:hypothetical protein|nr:hypothetical protein [Candidatus Saccharibacteria bacterium]